MPMGKHSWFLANLHHLCPSFPVVAPEIQPLATHYPWEVLARFLQHGITMAIRRQVHTLYGVPFSRHPHRMSLLPGAGNSIRRLLPVQYPSPVLLLHHMKASGYGLRDQVEACVASLRLRTCRLSKFPRLPTSSPTIASRIIVVILGMPYHLLSLNQIRTEDTLNHHCEVLCQCAVLRVLLDFLYQLSQPIASGCLMLPFFPMLIQDIRVLMLLHQSHPYFQAFVVRTILTPMDSHKNYYHILHYEFDATTNDVSHEITNYSLHSTSTLFVSIHTQLVME